MKEIKAYQCDFCKKYYKHKSSAKRHEKICYYNPNNKACLTCGNFDNLRTTMFGGAFCEAKLKEMTADDFAHDCKHWKPIEIEEYDEEYI